MQCPQHGVEFVLKPAGVSKRTGQPYSAFMVCPTFGCKEKPQREGGWQGVRQQVAEKVAPAKAAMTREDWEKHHQHKSRDILLQVAFKAAVELAQVSGHALTKEEIASETLYWHNWLLSQTEGQKPSSVPNFAPQATPTVHSGEVDGADIPFGDEDIPPLEVM